MPVFAKNDNKVLFVHIPKSAGTSIERAFENADWDIDFLIEPARNKVPDWKPCNPQHWHRDLIVYNIYPRYDITHEFTVVRNPFTRCISELMWRHGGDDLYSEDFFARLQIYIVNNLSNYINNEKQYQQNKQAWLDGTNIFHMDNHWRPQHHFVGQNTEVYYYERLDECWKEMQFRYSLPELPTMYNKVDLKKIRPTKMGIKPSDRFVELYTQVYGEDHERFGYELPF